MTNRRIEKAVANALLAGRLQEALGNKWRWLRTLAQRFEAAFGDARPRQLHVAAFLREDRGFQRAVEKYKNEITIRFSPARMHPVLAANAWGLPAIESVGELADWLCLAPSELDWLADLRGMNTEGRVENYHYRAESKRSGGVRLIEAPKLRLKAAQQRILADILDKIPPHPSAHGFVAGRSIQSFAAPHVGKPVVLKLDLENFFPSVAALRIHALFRTLGYPESVADLLAGLCTNAVPKATCRILRANAELYHRSHLPQGAPTSPALANVYAYRADCRLSGLAESAGLDYTRYADDLAFSGARISAAFRAHVCAILLEEGLLVNHRKTRIMRQGVRQRLAGLVTNQCLNVAREDFDLLKATLTNCARLGPQSQNRAGHPHFRSHLAGRVAFVASVNPIKGLKLREIFNRIDWSHST
ncbi:MAG: reverse transcriptase family protein [Bryobacteraceae bacterium]